MAAISIKNLNKSYFSKDGNKKDALKDISLEIPKGSFFGLLGPNGAGKSTIINILAGLTLKSSGEVKVCGFDLDKEQRQVKQSLGIVPQELVLDPFFSVREALEFHAGYYGVPKSERRTDEIIKALSLQDKAGVGARRLSGGMRRRLLIGKALVHNPPVLILDEPTAGVDIELRRQLWDYVRELNSRGTTIVLTTHYLEEADELCDRIAIINKGQIVASNTKEKLLSHIENKRIIFRLTQPIENIPENIVKYNAKLLDSSRLEIQYNPGEVQMGEILAAVDKAGLSVNDLVSEDTKLEDIFLQITKAA